MTHPIVFMCASCNLIIGDSLSLVELDESAAKLRLERSTNVVLAPNSPVLEIDDVSDPHLGCSTSPVACSGCSTQLGNKFVNVPSSLRELQDQIDFDTNKLASYQTGSLGLRASKSPNPNTIRAKGDDDEISMLKQTVLALHQRLAEVERKL